MLKEFLKDLYYSLNKEIQELLVKIKMLFLRSLEIFISSRDIFIDWTLILQWSQIGQLCTTGYRLLDYFEFDSVCSCSYIQVSNRHALHVSIANKLTDAVRHCNFFKQSLWCFFRSVELTFFVNSFI